MNRFPVTIRGGDYTTLQSADDALDAGAYTVYVKNGTYAAGLTVSTNDARWVFEPGTTVQAGITFSGSNIECIFMPGCDVQGLLTMSGTHCHVKCMNGCNFDGILMSGAEGYFHGGGWDTISDTDSTNQALDIQAVDCIARCFTCQATSGGEGGNDTIVVAAGGDRAVLEYIRVTDSDDAGIDILGDDVLVYGCYILGADGDGINIGAPRARVMGNFITACADDGIQVAAAGDNSVIVANSVKNITGS